MTPTRTDDDAASLESVMASVEASIVMTETDDGLWRGPNVALPGYRRLFGGQLLAQALAAAAVPGRTARSVHLVFCAEGRPGDEVVWSVDAVQDGRTFSTRAVTAMQGDRVLATGVLSLFKPTEGEALEHTVLPPVVPPPAALAPVSQLVAMAFETRPFLPHDPLPPGAGYATGTGAAAAGGRELADPPAGSAGIDGSVPPEAVPGARTLDGLAVGPPELAVWLRAPRPPRPDEPVVHQALLAYASDLTMMVAAMRPHEAVGFGAPSVAASAVTSHTAWFHRPFRADEWLLFVQESPAAHGGCAYARGDCYDGHGRVVASFAQEILVRLASPG